MTLKTNQILYDENLNPTPLMSEFLKDIRDSGIYSVLEKYSDVLPPHEVVGFISSELHCHSSKITLLKRVNTRKSV